MNKTIKKQYGVSVLWGIYVDEEQHVVKGEQGASDCSWTHPPCLCTLRSQLVLLLATLSRAVLPCSLAH